MEEGGNKQKGRRGSKMMGISRSNDQEIERREMHRRADVWNADYVLGSVLLMSSALLLLLT